MQKLNRGIAGLVALLVCVMFVANAQASPTGTKVGDSLLVESVDQIGVSEFWQLGKEPSLYTKKGNPPGGALAFWLHDYEQAPRKGDWVAVALVGVGFGDLKEVPVLVRVWAKSPSEIMSAKLTVQEQQARPG